jgi:hypothetical protein
MSEEVKNNAVELTDEELDKISGGYSILISINQGGYHNCDICQYSGMHPDNFYTKLYQGAHCNHWTKHYNDPINVSRNCHTCTNYSFDSRIGNDATSYLQKCVKNGYEYKYI